MFRPIPHLEGMNKRDLKYWLRSVILHEALSEKSETLLWVYYLKSHSKSSHSFEKKYFIYIEKDPKPLW